MAGIENIRAGEGGGSLEDFWAFYIEKGDKPKACIATYCAFRWKNYTRLTHDAM